MKDPRGADDLADAQLTILLGLSFQVLLSEFIRRVDAAGYDDLRPVHGATLQALKGPGLTSTELSERLGMTKQAAGQLVDELQRKKYVRRMDHPLGGRRRLVVLTWKAHQHLETAGEIMRALEAELAEHVGDLTALRAELARIIRNQVGEEVPPLRPQW